MKKYISKPLRNERIPSESARSDSAKVQETTAFLSPVGYHTYIRENINMYIYVKGTYLYM